MSRKPSRPSDAELRLVAPVSAVDSRHGGSRRAGALLVCRSPNVRQLAAGRRPRAARRCSVEAVRPAFGSEGCGGGTVWLWVRPLYPDAFNAFEARGWEDKAASYDHFVGDITPGPSSLS